MSILLFVVHILLLIVPSLSNDVWPAVLYDSTNSGGSAAKFGISISADEWTALSNGKSMAIGAPGANLVRLYTLTDDGASVLFKQELSPSQFGFPVTNIMFGQSVSVHGVALAVGSPCDVNPQTAIASGSVSFLIKNTTTGVWALRARVFLPSGVPNTACTTSPVSGLGTNVRIVYAANYSTITATTNTGIIVRVGIYRNGTIVYAPVVYDNVTSLPTMTGFGVSNDITRTVISSPTTNTVDVYSGTTFEKSLVASLAAGSLYGTSVSIHSWSPTVGDHVVAVGAPGISGGVGAVYIFEYWTSVSPVSYGITKNTWNLVQTITPPAPDDSDRTLGFGTSVTLKNTNLVVGTTKGTVFAYSVTNYSAMDSGNRYGQATKLPYLSTYVGTLTTACWYLYGYDPILQQNAYISLALAGINGTVFYSRPYCAPSYADPLCATRCVLAPVGGACLDGPNNNGSLSLPPGVIPPQVPPPPPPPSTTGSTPPSSTTGTLGTSSVTTGTVGTTGSVGTTGIVGTTGTVGTTGGSLTTGGTLTSSSATTSSDTTGSSRIISALDNTTFFAIIGGAAGIIILIVLVAVLVKKCNQEDDADDNKYYLRK